MMLKADVIIGTTTRTIYHTDATVAALKAGARVLTLTHCELGTLSRGAIEADFAVLEPVAIELASRLTAAKQWRITTAGGTDVSGRLDGRAGRANTSLCHHRGEVMGVPDVEAFVAPVDGETNGTIVIDASTSVMGLIDQPIRLRVESGRVVDISGGPQAEELRAIVDTAGPSARVIAEIGIGLNPEAKVSGAIIEDECAYGTGHFALGRNTTFGGNNDSPVHIDMVYWKPTIVLDGQFVMKGGELVAGMPRR
jgi:leucyl aminopeptidase (aminopeptidase T)